MSTTLVYVIIEIKQKQDINVIAVFSRRYDAENYISNFIGKNLLVHETRLNPNYKIASSVGDRFN